MAEPTKPTKKYIKGIIVCKLVFSVCFTTPLSLSLSLTCRSFVNNNSITLLRLYYFSLSDQTPSGNKKKLSLRFNETNKKTNLFIYLSVFVRLFVCVKLESFLF